MSNPPRREARQRALVRRGLAARALADLADLPSVAFAMVMATGIVSIAAWQQGHRRIAWALFALNVFGWLALWLLGALRALLHPRRLLADLVDHLRGPGFFTVVAATAVLGAQALVLAGAFGAAVALYGFAVALWLALTYTVFAALTVKERKPTLDKGISGGWLLGVVSTQSIAVLSALIAAHPGAAWKSELNFFALSMWSWGGMLYIWTMSLIFYRYTFFPLPPGELSPPYWINMGAMAISTLAGSLLVVNAADAPFLHSLLPFLEGFTVFYWATGTWWIPMLLVLGAWRYLYKRYPLRYETQYWSAVFPLGMYAACTWEMAFALRFDFLWLVPRAFLYLSLAAWSAAFAGLLWQLFRWLRQAA